MTIDDRNVQEQIKALKAIGADWKQIRALIIPDLIREEMNECGVELARSCTGYVAQYIETGNFYFLDLALIACADKGIAPTPTLLRLLRVVAAKRLDGYAEGTAEKALAPMRKAHALYLMANLRFRGHSLKAAAIYAAGWYNDTYGCARAATQGLWKFHTYKASTLEKEYEKAFKKDRTEELKFTAFYGEKGKDLESLLFDRWKRWEDENNEKLWVDVIKGLPQLSDEHLGKRR